MQLADHVALGMAYWARPSQGFAIAAIGAAAVLSPTATNDRFAAVDDEWRLLLSDALIESESQDLPAVGPTVIGGFSFDPDGPRSTRWMDFPSAHLIVPQLHLTMIGGESWLTVATVVDEHGKPNRSSEELANLRGSFLSTDLSRTHDEGSVIELNSDLPEDQWKGLVAEAVQTIRSDELRKVVLARSVQGLTSQPANPFAVLRQLSLSHRDALIYGYGRGEKVFAGASPERLVSLEGNTVSASSLAGTVKRGTNPEEDETLAFELQASSKDLGEHAAVRDMLHEILSEVGDDVSSPETPGILTLSNVHHLHTEVTANLRNGYSLLDVVSRIHPSPAVGGSPRQKALDFIRENENLDRGWYAGPVGWMDRNGGEFAVALRSGIIDGPSFALYAGCGIVADSNPAQELAESTLKLDPMLSAISASLEVEERELMSVSERSE
jgi:isochorismate synthase